MSKNVKKLLVAAVVMVMTFALAACGGNGETSEAPAVSTDSGAISVTPIDLPDYETNASVGDEYILMAKEGEGHGSGAYICIDGADKDGEDVTWSMRCPSYVNGEEYTLDMMLSDLQSENEYKEYTKTTFGDQEYIANEANSTSMYYYTVANNHPVLVQVVGTDELDEEVVADTIASIVFNY